MINEKFKERVIDIITSIDHEINITDPVILMSGTRSMMSSPLLCDREMVVYCDVIDGLWEIGHVPDNMMNDAFFLTSLCDYYQDEPHVIDELVEPEFIEDIKNVIKMTWF